jgi:hypothetical protein
MPGSNARSLLGVVLAACALFGASPASAEQVPGLIGREGNDKDRLLKRNGSNSETEAAVARGIAWLSRQQLGDGSWSFNGSTVDSVAATGLALLPLLAVDQAPNGNDKYCKVVDRGVKWLVNQLDKDGSFKGTRSEFAQALGTIALCDAARLSQDDRLTAKAALAVEHIVKSQAADGNWGVRRRKPIASDALVIGWQIQALDSARMAGIEFDKGGVYSRADKFLKSISTGAGAIHDKFGDRPAETLTAVGLLSRYLMGTLTPTDSAFEKGVLFLQTRPPQTDPADFEYYYFATRVLFAHGGENWHKVWNPVMRDSLIDWMHKQTDDSIRGSWDPDQQPFGDRYGRLGTTCLSILTLEVYYRYRERSQFDGAPEK